MFERLRILAEEIFIKILTIAVKMLSKLKRVILYAYEKLKIDNLENETHEEWLDRQWW